MGSRTQPSAGKSDHSTSELRKPSCLTRNITRTDTRTYEDRKKLYEGGWEILYCEFLEKDWKEKFEEFSKHAKAKLPKWFGERPGKKAGAPDSPEDEDELPAE